MVLTNIQIACPLCGSKNVSSIKQLGKWSIMRCANCSLGFTHPPCEQQDYEAEYFGKDNHPEADRTRRTALSELPLQHQRMVLLQAETCLRLAPKRCRVLDIGCGEGLLMEQLATGGIQCQGIDPSVEATQFAQKAGLNVVRGYFPHPDIHGPFDVVNMSHVLEHIADPKVLLRDVACIAPGGHLVLTQTNYRGVIPRTFDKWYGWCPEGHFWHFTPKALRSLLQEAGFTVESVTQLSMTHQSRRHKYILSLLDKIPGASDQFVLVARIGRS
jgi:2-polyprenyl-3-methyl-5-hydroxy-6-metoxy-1,4-benzoquinol methylase